MQLGTDLCPCKVGRDLGVIDNEKALHVYRPSHSTRAPSDADAQNKRGTQAWHNNARVCVCATRCMWVRASFSLHSILQLPHSACCGHPSPKAAFKEHFLARPSASTRATRAKQNVATTLYDADRKRDPLQPRSTPMLREGTFQAAKRNRRLAGYFEKWRHHRIKGLLTSVSPCRRAVASSTAHAR